MKKLLKLAFGSIALRHFWLSRSTGDHLEGYWNDTTSPNRTALIDLIRRESSGNKSVLDYGSHVGITLRLLLEDSISTPCFAVEPNRAAFDFMAAKLPSVSAICADDKIFSNSGFPFRTIDISVVNGVFTVMSEKRVVNVLEKLCRISNSIIIGDSVENVDGSKAKLVREPLHYQHAFKPLLQSFGFGISKVIPAPSPVPQMQAFIVAKKLTPEGV